MDAPQKPYLFGDPYKPDTKARQFDIFFYLFSHTQLFEGIQTQYQYKKSGSYVSLKDDSRYANNIEQMKQHDDLLDEQKLYVQNFLKDLRDHKVDANYARGAGSTESTSEALYKHAKESGLYSAKDCLAFDASLHGFLNLLSYTFCMEFLLTFASVGSKTDCKIRHLSQSQEDICLDFSVMMNSFLNEEPSKRAQLGKFLEELMAFQNSLDTKTEPEKKSKQSAQVEKKSVLTDYKNALLKTETGREDTSEFHDNHRLIDSCYGLLARCLFLTENFQREQGTLWRDDPMTSELLWNFARKMCIELNLYSKRGDDLKDSVTKFLAAVNHERNGTSLVFMKQFNFAKSTEKKQMMLRRYFFKNKYSLNTFESNLDISTTSQSFTMYFMAQGGDSKVWQEGSKRQSFSAALIDEVLLDRRRVETVAGVSMTEVDLKAVFSTIQVTLGMASDIVETFYNFLIYYDDVCKTIRICKLLKQSELKEVSSGGKKVSQANSREFNDIKKQGRNIHAVTCSRNVLKASDEVRIVLATSWSHIDSGTSFILFVVPGHTPFRDFVRDQILRVYNPDLDPDKGYQDFLKHVMLTTTSKFKSNDAEHASYRVLEDKHLGKDDHKASVDEIKTEFIKYKKCNPTPGTSEADGPQYLEPDFIMSLEATAAKRLINLREVDGEVKKTIQFKPSLTGFLDYCLKADKDASALIADLHVRAAQQLAAPETLAEGSMPKPLPQNWQYSLEFFLPYYYLINMEKLRDSVSISNGLEIKAVESENKMVMDSFKNKFLSNKYRLTAFVTKHNDSKVNDNYYCVYEVTTISFKDLAESQYQDLFKAFVKATYGESCKLEPLKEELKKETERTIKFLTVKRPLPLAERKAKVTCSTSHILSDFKETGCIEWALFERQEAF